MNDEHPMSDQNRHQAARARLSAAMHDEAARVDASWQMPRVLSAPSWRVHAAAIAAVVVAAVAIAWRGGHGAAVVAEFVRPSAGLTPGAVSSLSAAQLCAGARPSRIVTASVRSQVLRAYGMEQASPDSYELDALITPELGGTTDAANLWPQRYASPVWNAHVKDALEDYLATEVCRQRMDLATAQREIASDWVAAYQHHFATSSPLLVHRQRGPELEELRIVTDEQHERRAPEL